MSYPVANIAVSTDTFAVWVNRTNTLLNALSNYIVTVDGTASGNQSTGSGYVFGTFGADYIAVGTKLRGGNVASNTALTVESNTTFEQRVVVTGAANALSTFGITGAANVLSTLGVNGAANLNSTLGVNGATRLDSSLNVVGAANIQSSANVGGTFGVTGAANALSTFGVNGAANLNSTLGVNGATRLESTLNVVGAANIQSSANVGGTFGVTGAANALSTFGITGAANALSTFGVNGAANLNSTLGVNGATRLASSLNVTGAANLESSANVGGTFGVTGAANALSTFGVNGAANLNSTLGVNGAARLASTLNVIGAANLESSANVGGTFGVTGAANVLSTFGITGAANALSTFGVNGAANLNSTLGVNGAARLASALNVTGVANLESSANVGGTFGVTGAANVLSTFGITGAANALSTFGVNGAANLNSTLGVNGAARLASTLNVVGAANIQSSANVGGTFGVTGAANALSTFGITGAANALSTFGVNGATRLESTLNVVGSANIQSSANVGGTLGVTGVSTFNTNIVLGGGLSANGGFGTAGQALHTNGSNVYWDTTGVRSLSTTNGIVGGTITSTGTISVLANNGIIANTQGLFVIPGTGITVNTTGVHINSAYIGIIAATANNANFLDAQPASYYTNATNLASGTVPTARLGTGTANSTTYLRGDQTYATAVTSITGNDGLSGGTVTTTGTFSVRANTGIVANATGVFVNTAFIGTIASNSATFANQSVTNTFTVGTSSYFVSNGFVGIGTSSPGAAFNVVASTGSDAVRISQAGSGNAFVVEDTANPDTTPFVIDGAGRLVTGYTGPLQYNGANYLSHFLGSGVNFPLAAGYTSVSNLGPRLALVKNRSSDWSTQSIVSSGDTLGEIEFDGSDGNTFIVGARIEAAVDGAPGLYDMPGRLVFSTTADGGSAVTEHMRITSAGNVGIGNTAPNAKLQVTGTANISGAVAISGVTTFNANVILGSSGLSANGGFGTAGQVLHSNGTAVYWAGDDGTVTSVGSGNGLAGGPITTTGTLSVLANNGLVSNSTGTYVNANSGIVANSTGTYVNANSGIVANSTGTFVRANNGIVSNATGTFVLANNGLVSNSTGVFVTPSNGSIVVSSSGVSVNAAYIATIAANSATGSLTNTFTVGTAAYFVSNGNLGLGTSSPANILSVNGSMNASNYYMQDGSATAAGTYGFATSNGPWIQTWGNSSAQAGALVFGTSGSERARIDSSGNVGIGSSSPSARLHVYSGATDEVARFEGTGNPFISLYDTNIRQGYFYSSAGAVQVVAENSKPLQLITSGAQELTLYTTNLERVRVDASGNVGIGNSAPNAKLQVTGTANISGAVTLASSLTSANLTTTTNTATFGTNVYLAANGFVGIGNSAPNAKLQVTGTANISGAVTLASSLISANLTTTTNTATFGTAAYFVANGNLGIGTTIPFAKIEVAGSTGAGDTVPDLRVSGNGVVDIHNNLGAGNYNPIIQAGDKGIIYWGSTSNTGSFAIAQWSDQTKGIRIDASGNVGIGSSTAEAKLRVDTTGGGTYGRAAPNIIVYNSNDPGIRMFNTGTSGSATMYVPGGAGGWAVTCNTNSAFDISTDTSGNFTARGNVTAYSDEKLKKDVENIQNALSIVMKLRGVKFKRIDNDDDTNIGFIAQEIQQHVPEVVHNTLEGYLGVSYGNITALLVEAIKELSSEVNVLKAEINQLKGD